MSADYSEDPDAMHIALTAMLVVAAYEGELVEFLAGCELCPEAAAAGWMLADAGLTLVEAGAFLRFENKAAN